MKRVILVLLLLVLAACGPPALETGVVIDREFVPEHEETYTENVPRTETYIDYDEYCTGIYPNETCVNEPTVRTRTVYDSVERCCRIVPDEFFITIRGGEGTEDGERTNRVRVSRESYDACTVGRRWSHDQPVCRPQ